MKLTADMIAWLEAHSAGAWLSALAAFAETFSLDTSTAVELWEEWLDS